MDRRPDDGESHNHRPDEPRHLHRHLHQAVDSRANLSESGCDEEPILIREASGPRFERARAESRALPLDDAVALALESADG
jgi:hypothetical protein